MQVWTYLNILEFLVLAVIGFSSFGLAIWMHKSPKMQSRWYISLKYILILISISAVSDGWSTVLIAREEIRPIQLLLSVSVLALLAWLGCFCRFKLLKSCTGPVSVGKFLTLLTKEITD